MTVKPCIVFEAVEPPNPHLDDRSWEWVPRPGEDEARGRASERETPRRRQALLSPSSVAVAINVTQALAKATITQTFCNDAPDNIDKAIYQFPIPYESSVVDFKCQIGETKTLQGHVKPKPEAREEFNNAVNSGHSAGLVEQNRLDIFRTEIGNIPPHTTVEVELSFIFFLKYTLTEEVTTTVLTIPTYIAPRYGSPGFELFSETGPQRNTRFSLDIDVLTSTEIRDIKSDTHEVIVEKGGRPRFQRWANPSSPEHTAASVKLKDTACLDKDFILSISAHPSIDDEQPQATLETSPSGSSALIVEIPARFMLRDQQPMNEREIIFVADQSGSMIGDKIPGLQSSLEFFLHGLPPATFNLYCFGSDYTSLWPESREYNDDTLAEALEYVSHFSNDMGGTELLPALMAVISSRGKGKNSPLDVIVLTDGEVWQLEETLDFVRKARAESGGAVRFFTMGIGGGVSHELVEGVARAGGGYAEVIPLTSRGNWDARMVAMLKAAMSGHIAGVEIEVEGIVMEYKDDTGTVPTVQMSPGDLSTMSPFVRNRIYILAESNQINASSVVKIKRKSTEGQETVTAIPLNVLQEKDFTLHQFAAGTLLRDIGIGQSWIQRDEEVSQGSHEERELSRKEGERLGCKYSLVSQWTSFVAVETTPESMDGESQPPARGEYAMQITNMEDSAYNSDLLDMPVQTAGFDHFGQFPQLHSVAGSLEIGKKSLNDVYYRMDVVVDSIDSRRVDMSLFRTKARTGWGFLSNLGLKSSTPTSQTTVDEPSFLRRVLKFQKSTGVFEVPKNDALKCLGPDAHDIVKALHEQGIEWDLAVTVVVIVWLEMKHPEDRSLWTRMVEKAREYMHPHLGMKLGDSEERSMLDIAEQMVGDAKDPINASDEVIQGLDGHDTKENVIWGGITKVLGVFSSKSVS